MNDAVLLYVFVFLMVSNMLLSLIYAFGARQIKNAARKALRDR